MALPRRRSHDELELPELPPLDGDDTDTAVDPGDDVDEPADDDPASLDDAAADDLAYDELDELEELGEADEGEGPAEPGDDAEEIDGDDDERWTGDDAREPDEGDEVEELGGFAPDDQGVEGPEGDLADELEALPPLDDDPEGDRPMGDESAEIPELGAFALPRGEGYEARVLIGEGASPPAPAATALSVSVGRDRVYAVGDALVALPLSSLDDAGAGFESVGGLDVDELLSSVLEDASGALWLGAFSGSLWRRARARDPWRRVASLSEGRSTGAVELHREGRRVWARTELGTLHRSDDGARFEAALTGEHVRALAVDARDGVVAALSGRRRDALRTSSDGGRTWAALVLPDEATVRCVARASEVLVVAQEGGGPGYVSVDSGATWAPWPLLAGATAVALVEADDGDARVLFAAHDESADRVALAVARVGGRGEPVGARQLCDVDATLPRTDHDDDEGAHRVERVVPLDRGVRHVALVTSRGAVVLVSMRG